MTDTEMWREFKKRLKAAEHSIAKIIDSNHKYNNVARKIWSVLSIAECYIPDSKSNKGE